MGRDVKTLAPQFASESLGDHLSEIEAQHQQAAGLMNEGFAFLSQGDAAALSQGIEKYSQAIALFQLLPPNRNPAWSNSLGAAWMNRGSLYHRLYGASQAALALQDFDDAIAILNALSLDGQTWPRRNLAGTHLNRAQLLIYLKPSTKPSAEHARDFGLSSTAKAKIPSTRILALNYDARRATLRGNSCLWSTVRPKPSWHQKPATGSTTDSRWHDFGCSAGNLCFLRSPCVYSSSASDFIASINLTSWPNSFSSSSIRVICRVRPSPLPLTRSKPLFQKSLAEKSTHRETPSPNASPQPSAP